MVLNSVFKTLSFECQPVLTRYKCWFAIVKESLIVKFAPALAELTSVWERCAVNRALVPVAGVVCRWFGS